MSVRHISSLWSSSVLLTILRVSNALMITTKFKEISTLLSSRPNIKCFIQVSIFHTCKSMVFSRRSNIRFIYNNYYKNIIIITIQWMACFLLPLIYSVRDFRFIFFPSLSKTHISTISSEAFNIMLGFLKRVAFEFKLATSLRSLDLLLSLG